MDPENLLLMRAHMNQYVAVAEDISDTSILGHPVDWSDWRGTTALSLTFANFRFPSLPASGVAAGGGSSNSGGSGEMYIATQFPKPASFITSHNCNIA